MRVYTNAEFHALPPMMQQMLRDGGWREEAVPEIEGPAGVVAAVATGSGSVSSDEVLQEAEEYEREATRLQEIADVADNTTHFKTHCARKAARKRLCAEVLLRHAASMTERQPSPNTKVSHGPERVARRDVGSNRWLGASTSDSKK